MQISVLGIDLAKLVFPLYRVDEQLCFLGDRSRNAQSEH